MKKLMSIVLALCMALSLCTTAWAADVTETDLHNAAAAGGTITLTGDIALTKPVVVAEGKTLTIDLAGHNITPKNPTTDESATGAFHVEKDADNKNQNDYLIAVKRGGNLTINDSVGNGKIDTGNTAVWIYSAIKMTIKGEGETGSDATLTVNGGTLKGYYYAVCGNGARHGTVITINGGTLGGYADNDHYAIFHPQAGTLTINGGALEGTTGIEMRAGTLNVNGGTIKSTGYSGTDGKTYETKASGSGSTTWGAAIAVAEHTTKLGVTVNIKGGTIIDAAGTGKALSVADPQGVRDTSTKPVTVNITGGSVNGAIEQTNAFGDAKPTTITGGQFDTDVTEFVPVDTAVATSGSSYYVGSDSIADAANSGKDMTMVQGGAIDGLEPGAHIIVPKDVTGTTLNGEAAEWGDYTIADPNAYQHEPIRRQHTTTTVEDTTTTTATKADDTTKADTVTSAKTFDAGVAVYGVMAVLSLAGTAAVIGKKKEF